MLRIRSRIGVPVKPEIFPQAVGQIAQIILGQGIQLVAEQGEGGRPRLDLGHVADAHPPAPDRGRGMALQRALPESGSARRWARGVFQAWSAARMAAGSRSMPFAGAGRDRHQRARPPPAAAAGPASRAIREIAPALFSIRSHLLTAKTMARPSRAIRSAMVRSCFSKGWVASIITITQSAKRMASRVEATDISSSVSPATRAFLRRPAVSCSRTSRLLDLPGRGDGVAGEAGFRPGEGALLAQQAVEQARLADIGPAHQGQLAAALPAIIEVRLLPASSSRRKVLPLRPRPPSRGTSVSQRIRQSSMPSACSAEIASGSPKPRRKGLRRRLDAAFAFVGGQDHRLAGAVQRRRDDLVAGGDAGAGVDHEQQRIGFGDGGQGLAGHARAQGVGRGFLEAGGVDQAERHAVEHRFGHAAVAGHAGRVMDDGDPPPGEAVEQAGLADIGPADDGDGEAASAHFVHASALHLSQRHQFGVVGVDIERAVGHDRRDVGAVRESPPGPAAGRYRARSPRHSRWTTPRSAGWKPAPGPPRRSGRRLSVGIRRIAAADAPSAPGLPCGSGRAARSSPVST